MKAKVSVILFVVAFLMNSTGVLAANAEEVVFNILEMSCDNCKDKITKNIRFEKGMKALAVDVATKTATIKFDPDKTSIEKLQEAFKKLGYTAVVKTGDEITFKTTQMSCGGCAGKIKNALTAMEGVTEVVTDVPTRTVKINYDAAVTNEAALKESLNKINYTPSLYFADDNVAYVLFKADQMTCGGCAAKVKKAISGVKGVKDVNVNLGAKIVGVSYDSKVTNIDGLNAGFKTIDYEVTEVGKK